MNFFSGIVYNFRGLWLGIRTPKLLMLGMVRFLVLILLTVILGSLVLTHRHELVNMIWNAPESPWILWLWVVVSWLISLLLLGISALTGYLASQILFSVIIMDAMSVITERIRTGDLQAPPRQAMLHHFLALIKQELPRALIPVTLLMLLMVLGWLTPLAPVISVLSSSAAVVFLAWDNTDLTPARRMVPFKQRFKFLLKTLPFHLGFGLPFMIPILNALLLSFAPVGATLFQIEKEKRPVA